MKVKIIMTCVLAGLAFNANSMTLYKAKIIDSRTWKTGNVIE